MNPPDSDPAIPLQPPKPSRYYTRLPVSSDHTRHDQVLLPKRRTRHSSISASLSSNVTSQLETWQSWLPATVPWSAILVAVLALQAALVIALAGYAATALCGASAEVGGELDCRTGPGAVLLAIAGVEALYLVLLAAYAVKGKHVVLLLGLCANAAALGGFIALQGVEITEVMY